MSGLITNDLYLVVGVVVLILAVPALLGSIFDRRPPRATAIMVLIGGGLIALAVAQQPGGYSLEDIPRAFTNVIGTFIR